MTGRTILQYRVLEKLGEGGMGAVFKALDTRLDRLVAIKVLPSGKISDEDLKGRLIREARAASALNHPNIITIYEIETAERDGQKIDFIVMEYVGGRTLEHLIGTRGLPIDKVLKYGAQIAAALTAAHEMGIIHRDLKPSNIMVTDSGHVKVLDFGLAKLTEPALGPDADLTRTLLAQTGKATLIGTAAYMSPEQVEGQPADSRSDIFSFGSTLYEMMTGERAFQRQTVTSTIVAILRDDPKTSATGGPAFPQQLHHVVNRCLRKDPNRRIQHMVEVKLELEELQAELEAGSPGGKAAGVPAVKRRWLWPILSVSAAIAVAGMATFAITQHQQFRPILKVIPLATYPGLERYPSLSPDGRQVAFSWNGPKQEHSDIYVKLVAGGGPLRLTTSPDQDTKPRWSPDGERIAFVRGNSILQVSSLGGLERKVRELRSPFFGHQLAWTHDAASVIVPNAASEDDPYGLWSFKLEGGPGKKLTSPPEWSVGDCDPAVSHDGRKLAFARWLTTSSADLFVTDMDGGAPRRLTEDNARINGLTWTPDGREVVFSSNRDGSFGLWRTRASGNSGTSPSRVIGAGPGAVSPVISDGPPVRLACARIGMDFNIGRIDLPITPRGAGSGIDIIASTRTDDSPRFSPDGSKVAFVSDRTGSSEIWLAKSDGSNQMQLTFLESSSGSPHWSPDGLSIVFDSLTRGNKEIFAVSVDGGIPRRLTTEKSQEWRPSYSRNGSWIYFGSDRSRSPQIWKMPSGGGAAIQVTRNGGYEALESLDGKTLYYTKSRSRQGLWSAPLNGGQEVAVLPAVLTGFWDVADQGLYFFEMSGTSPSGLPLKFYSPRKRQIADVVKATKGGTSGTPGLSVTRDGTSVLYVRADQSDSELTLLENFR
jgi:eukaryotic-like serine/threonine-protein kinase